jgi:prophage regulatory protein
MTVQKQTEKPKRILRQPKVLERTGFAKSSLWKLIKDGDFPQPIRLTKRTIGWLESDIELYIERLCNKPWTPHETCRRPKRQPANVEATASAERKTRQVKRLDSTVAERVR